MKLSDWDFRTWSKRKRLAFYTFLAGLTSTVLLTVSFASDDWISYDRMGPVEVSFITSDTWLLYFYRFGLFNTCAYQERPDPLPPNSSPHAPFFNCMIARAADCIYAVEFRRNNTFGQAFDSVLYVSQNMEQYLYNDCNPIAETLSLIVTALVFEYFSTVILLFNIGKKSPALSLGVMALISFCNILTLACIIMFGTKQISDSRTVAAIYGSSASLSSGYWLTVSSFVINCFVIGLCLYNVRLQKEKPQYRALGPGEDNDEMSIGLNEAPMRNQESENGVIAAEK